MSYEVYPLELILGEGYKVLGFKQGDRRTGIVNKCKMLSWK